MRRFFYVGFCALLTLAAGCALTNYSLITDWDYPEHDAHDHIVNTHGKALIRQLQPCLIWPDGMDSLFWMVDQQSNGDRTLTTYDYYSTGTGHCHLDMLYCDPNWTGCALWTSQDPETKPDDPFDGKENPNCGGFRSLSLLVSTTRYYGECGKTLRNLTVAQKLMVQEMMQATDTGFFGKFDASDTSLFLTSSDGTRYTVPVFAGTFQINPREQRVRVDLTNPNTATTLRYLDGIVKESPDNLFEIAVRWNGLEVARDVKILEGKPGELAISRY